MKKEKYLKYLLILISLVVVGILAWLFLSGYLDEAQRSGETSGEIVVETIVEDLDHPWDLKLDSEGVIFFTQRGSGLYKFDEIVEDIYLPEDLYSAGEGGMLGFDLAPDFGDTREVYACFNSNKNSNLNVVVARLTLNESLTGIEERTDIISDIPAAESGRHSGCRVRFDRKNENTLWVTTGDAADGNNPQNPKSLGGKVLRVDRDGSGVEGNLEEPFDSRIFSYGHRNIQGITLFDEYNEEFGYGFTSEHGPDVDDEINPLVKGNFGWDPNLPYDESVPMTDIEKFPDAIESAWSSGDRTIAMCGIEYIEEGKWNGDILLSALKDSYILRFDLDNDSLIREEKIVDNYGRIRQIYESENGRIFFTTDRGGNDIIGEVVVSD